MTSNLCANEIATEAKNIREKNIGSDKQCKILTIKVELSFEFQRDVIHPILKVSLLFISHSS